MNLPAAPSSAATAQIGAQAHISAEQTTSSTPVPDLSMLAGDVVFTLSTPTADTLLTMAVTTHNIGTATATSASLLVTDTLVLNNSVVSAHTYRDAFQNVPPQGQATFSDTTTVGPAGIHLVCARIFATNPSEENLTNNEVCRALEVSAASGSTASSTQQGSGGVSAPTPAVTSGALVVSSDMMLAAGLYTYTSILVTNQATLALQGNASTGAGVTIFAERIQVDTGAHITADGQGYVGQSGAGAGPGGGSGGTCSGYAGGGGAYGGLGGASNYSGGSAYGSLSQPLALGSAGGSSDYYGVRAGGNGGGAIRLLVSDTLTIDGILSANGNSGTYYRAGGGSGGSLWVSAGTISGNGKVQANGGDGGESGCCGAPAGGGGSGGRIALFYGSSTLPFDPAHVQTYGGGGNQYGGPGTVYLRLATGDPRGALLVDNATHDSQYAVLPADQTYAFESITLSRGGNLRVTSVGDEPLTASRITVGAGSTMLLMPEHDGDTDYTNDRPFTLHATNVTIDDGGHISADGQGYAGQNGNGTGPGGGTGATCCGSAGGGGAHGGRGDDASYRGGVTTYGSATEPTTRGSAGGSSDYYGVRAGGNGGGAIRLLVDGTLTVNGTLSANGTTGYYRTGGGAGGSLWITTAMLVGSGAIEANGGAGGDPGCCSGPQGGGGGCGRVSITYGGTLPSTLTIAATGGAGYQPGEAGSVYRNNITVDPNASTVDAAPATVVANGSATGTITVTVRNGDGQPLANKPVRAGLMSGGAVFVNHQLVVPGTMMAELGTTDSSGMVTGVITATQAGDRVLFAQSGTDIFQDQAAISFVAGPVDAAHSQISLARAEAPADGTTPVTVTVTARDAYDNPVPDATIVLHGTGSVQVVQPVGSTDTLGQTRGTLTDAIREPVVVSATANGIDLHQTATVTFRGADLTLAITGPEAVGRGQPITYTVTVQNIDLATAPAVAVTDTLPPGVRYLSDTAPGAMSQQGQTLRWAIGDLSSGARVTFTVTAIVDSTQNYGTRLVNTIGGTTTSSEDQSGNNTASTTTTVVQPDLVVTQGGPDTLMVVVGAPVTYTLAIHNASAAPAYSVVLTDTLPPGIEFVGATTPMTVSANGPIVTRQLGDVAPGATVRVELYGRVTANAVPGQPAVNQANALADEPDGYPADNSSTFTTRLVGIVDPARSTITVAPDRLPANGISPATVTVTVRDAYDHPLPGVTVVLTATGTASVAQPAVPTDLDGRATATITDTVVESVAVSASADHTALTNTAAVVFERPIVPPDLKIAQDDIVFSDPAPDAGAPITITATIRNTGAVTVTAATIALTSTTDLTNSVALRTTTPITHAIVPHGQVRVPLYTGPAPAPAGSQTVCVQVQSISTVPEGQAETNLDNNGACKRLNVIDPHLPLRQLVVRVPDLETWRGANASLIADVTNTGTQPITITDAAALGTPLAAITRLSPLPAAAIAPGGSQQLSFSAAVPPTIDGVSFPVSQTLSMVVTTTENLAASTPFVVRILDQPPTTLQVQVVDRQSNLSLPGALLMIDGDEQVYQSDRAGMASIPARPGTWTVYSYLPGYLARAVATTIQVGQTNTLTIALTPGNTFEVSDVKATLLSSEQVTGRGVSLSDPQNYHVYDFTIYLKVIPEGVPVSNVIVPANPSSGTHVDIPPSEVTLSSGASASVSGSFYYLSPTQRLETWLIIPGKFRILKQFWDATIYLKNEAQADIASSIVITDVQALLSVPAGMSLPDLNGQPQPAVRQVAAIGAGESRQVSWVVRGDATGAYLLGATVTGNLKFGTNPNLQPLSVTARPAEVVVYEPTLDVRYTVPSYVSAGAEFTVQMDIINTTPVAIDDVSVELEPDQIVNATLISAAQHTIGHMEVAGHASATFSLVSKVTGCISIPESYVAADPHITPHLNFIPGKCGGLLGESACSVGLTAFSSKGDFLKTVADFKAGLKNAKASLLQIVRTYNSGDTSSGAFGTGWKSMLDMDVQTNADGSVIVTQADGRQERYTATDAGVYITPLGSPSRLVKNADGGHMLTTAAQVSYDFDASGKLRQVRDAESNALTLNYNAASGDLASITDALSNTVTITTTADHRIAAISDGTSTYSYGYDARTGELHQIIDAQGATTTYGYDSAGLFNEEIDPSGHVILHNTYDGNNRLASQTNYSGPDADQATTTRFDYDSQPGNAIVTDSQGNRTTISVDSQSQIPNGSIDAQGNHRSYQLDGSGNPITVALPNGGVLRAEYNAAGLPTVVTSTVTMDGSLRALTSRISYNDTNDPLTIVNPRGATTTFHYLAPGKPDRVTDALGNVTTYAYDSRGRVVQMTSPGGLVTTYTYTGADLLASITRTYRTLALGSTTPTERSERIDYRYTPEGWLAYQSDPYDVTQGPGAGVSYTYDRGGHVLTITNQLGQVAVNTYDAVGNLVTYTNYLGQETRYTYDWLRRVTEVREVSAGGDQVTSYAYDSNGNLVRRTDGRGVTTTYTYDSLNRLTSTTVPQQDGGVDRIENRYDAVGNLVVVIHANSKGSGDQVTLYAYDELNRLIKTTEAAGIYNYQIVRTYDEVGNLVRVRVGKLPGEQITDWSDPAQATTVTATYDLLNRLDTTTVDAWDPTTGSPKTLASRNRYDDAQNQYTAISPAGVTTMVQQDAVGRPIVTTVTPATAADVQPGAQPLASYRFYDPRGLAIRSIDPAGNQRDVSYDALGRVIAMTGYTEANGGGTALTSTVHYTDSRTPSVTTIGPAPHFARHDTAMDDLGRVVSETIYTGAPAAYPQTPDGALTTRYTYDAQDNQTSVTDPTGHVAEFRYENTGWLTEARTTVTVPGQGVQTLATSYAYDSVGNPLRVTDPNGHVSTATYDVLNRLLSSTDPLGNTFTQHYDGAGRLIDRRDAKGQVTSYTYDNASRLLAVATGSELATTYTYNDASLPTTMVDRVGSAAPATTTYTYDGFERLAAVSNAQGLVQYGYDTASRLSQMRFGASSADAKQVWYQYDGLDRLRNLTNWQGETLTYQYSGERLKGVRYPNGTVAKFGYDGAGRLTALTHAANGSSLFGADYTLDSLGRPTRVREKQNGESRLISYTYDELSRLTSEATRIGSSQAVTSTYQYDAAGNRTQMTSVYGQGILATPVISTTTYAYDASDRLTSRTSETNLGAYSRVGSTYDANGNLLDDTTYDAQGTAQAQISYRYDAWDRLVAWQRQTTEPNGSESAAFEYDGSGARTAMSYGGETTSFLAAGAQVLEERPSGQPTASYLYTPGSSVPLFRADATGQGQWYHHDPEGSVRALSDGQSAASQNSYAFDTFGVTQRASGTTPNPRQFGGAQHDPTDLYYGGCGYYEPATTRLIGGCGGASGAGGGASPAGAYPLGPARPASGGHGLDAAAAQQLGRTLGHAPSGAFLPFGQPGCNVSCRYTVTLVKQPDPPPTTLSETMQQARLLGELIDRAVGVLGQLNSAQRAYTGYDFMASGAIAHSANLAKAFLVSPEGQFALGAANVAARLATHAVVFGLNLIPEVGVIQAVAGMDLYGNKLNWWQRILYAVPFAAKLAEVQAVGTAVREATQGAEEAGVLAGAAPNEAAAALGQAAREEQALGAAVAEETAAVQAEGALAESTTIAEESASVSESEAGLNGGTCSFSADTRVATEQGEQPIGELQSGDHVLAYDQASGTTGSYTVTAVLVHTDRHSST